MYPYLLSAVVIILSIFVLFWKRDEIRDLIYSYILSALLFIRSIFVILYRKRELKTKMEHMVGRLAKKFIETMLEQVREKIVTGGYGHWRFDLYQKEFALPDLFKCQLTIRNLLIVGASEFVTNNVSYDVTTSKTYFDISIPKLFLAIGDATTGASITSLGMNIDAQVKGWITLLEPRMIGAVVLQVNEEGKVVATSVDINVELKEIQSKVSLSACDKDFSEAVNNFLCEKLRNLINTYVNNCKGAIEVGLMSIANPILAQMF